MRSLISLSASNFLSLSKVTVELQDLTVLVGPNGAGKSNLLRVIQLLGDTARLDLVPAIAEHGGFERLLFRGTEAAKALPPGRMPRMTFGIKGVITGNSSENAPDEYQLSVWPQVAKTKRGDAFTVVRRRESFVFKRVKGRGRRITVSGDKVQVVVGDDVTKLKGTRLSLAESSSALSTLPRLKDVGSEQINTLAELFLTFRVFEIDVGKARAPSQFDVSAPPRLASDAGNLAGFLRWLSSANPDIFELLKQDLKVIVPSVKDLEIAPIFGTDDKSFYVRLIERGLNGATALADASFGTVRALALLAMLHDPQPPRLTVVEEIDHGLHPHALDRIVERLRSASRKTQLLVVTHSPALANRLRPSELVVCERDHVTGSSLIPAISATKVAAMAKASGLLPGELWFSGALGGSL